MVRRLEDSMGPEKMRAATGRDHEGWRAVLVEAGATGWSHGQTATWLVEQGVDPWWAQGITVDFEQAHKGRLPGMKPDGTFSASTTRTVPGGRLDALAAVAEVVCARYGEAHGQNLAASQPVVRWRLDDGTRLAATAGVENRSGTPVTLTRERLPATEDMDGAKAELTTLLDAARPAHTAVG